MEITGIVDFVKVIEGKYGIKIEDNWYNGFGDSPCNKGDKIKVTFTKNKQWNNVDAIEVLEAAPEVQPGEVVRSEIGETALRRHKLDCLLKSVDAWIEGKLEREEVIPFGLGLFGALGTEYPSEVDEANSKPEVTTEKI